LVKLYFSNFSQQNPTLPAARNLHFQTKDSSQARSNLLVGTVWRWTWFYCFIMTQPVVLQMKGVLYLKDVC